MAEDRPVQPGRVFLSYRREDTAFPAAWLYERLVGRFGPKEVFKDVDSIDLGDDFAEAISTAVGSCDVLLAMIGREWATITDAGGHRRLDDPNDFVRLEVETALQRDVRVIPILVQGATLPRAEQLPVSLRKLVRRQALELSPNQFEYDTTRLLRVVEETIAQQQAPGDAEKKQTTAVGEEGTSPGRRTRYLTLWTASAVIGWLVVVFGPQFLPGDPFLILFVATIAASVATIVAIRAGALIRRR
jgi:hypothetical protein